MDKKDKIKAAVAIVILTAAGVLIYFGVFHEPAPPPPAERAGLIENPPPATPPKTGTGPTAAPPPPLPTGPARGLAPGAGK